MVLITNTGDIGHCVPVCAHMHARGQLGGAVLSPSVWAPGWLGSTGLAAPTLLTLSPSLTLLPDVEQLKHLIIHL